MEKMTLPCCAVCGTNKQLLRCAKCKTAFYCSTEHQHIDWPSHKRECRLLARQKNNSKQQQMQQQSTITNVNCSNVINSNNYTVFVNNSNNELLANGYNNSYNNGYAVQQQQLQPNTKMSVILGAKEHEIVDNNCDIMSSQQIGTNLNGFSTDTLNIQQNLMEQMQFCDSNSYIDNSDGTSDDTSLKLQQQMLIDDQLQLDQHEMQFSQQYQQTPAYSHTQNLMQQQAMYQQQQTPQQQLQQQQIQLQLQQQQQSNNLFIPQFSNSHNNQIEKSSSYQIGRVDESIIGIVNERERDELCRNIINDMNQYGLSVVDDFLGLEKGLQILNDVHRMYAAGVFKDGQLVNNQKAEQDLRTIRGDKITWVTGVEQGCSNVGFLINQIDAVICRANSMKNNGKLGNYNIKERTKAMVACYPGSGSHYVMHVDNPNKDGRVITAIYYLNLNWNTEQYGGVLRIFPEHVNTVADIEPKFDRLIFFWSDKRNPHEVQPAHRTRYAITVWYFDANERQAALNRCKYNNNNNNVNDTENTKKTGTIKTTTSTASALAAAAKTNVASDGFNSNNSNSNSDNGLSNILRNGLSNSYNGSNSLNLSNGYGNIVGSSGVAGISAAAGSTANSSICMETDDTTNDTNPNLTRNLTTTTTTTNSNQSQICT